MDGWMDVYIDSNEQDSSSRERHGKRIWWVFEFRRYITTLKEEVSHNPFFSFPSALISCISNQPSPSSHQPLLILTLYTCIYPPLTLSVCSTSSTISLSYISLFIRRRTTFPSHQGDQSSTHPTSILRDPNTDPLFTGSTKLRDLS